MGNVGKKTEHFASAASILTLKNLFLKLINCLKSTITAAPTLKRVFLSSFGVYFLTGVTKTVSGRAAKVVLLLRLNEESLFLLKQT